MIEHTHEPHQIEACVVACEVVHLAALKRDPIGKPQVFRCPVCLAQVKRVDIDGTDQRPSTRELEAVKARITSDVEHVPAAQIGGNERADLSPLEIRKIAEAVVGGRLGSVRQV